MLNIRSLARLYSSSISDKSMTQFIKRYDAPSCIHCKYYKPYQIEDDYRMAKCTKFGRKDYVSGIVTHNYADLTRINKEMCGPDGIYFEKNT
jgi:hypothetical protein